MSYKVVLREKISDSYEITVTALNIQDGMLVKGKYRTPISNIKYVEEI